MLLELTRRRSKLCNEADNLSFSPNIITTINPSLCLKTEAYSASENSLDNTNNITCKSAPLWHFIKLWTGTLRRTALMLCIQEFSNSNYGRETIKRILLFDEVSLEKYQDGTSNLPTTIFIVLSFHVIFRQPCIQSTLLKASWNEICYICIHTSFTNYTYLCVVYITTPTVSQVTQHKMEWLMSDKLGSIWKGASVYY